LTCTPDWVFCEVVHASMYPWEAHATLIPEEALELAVQRTMSAVELL
jgi:hypothetical protein